MDKRINPRDFVGKFSVQELMQAVRNERLQKSAEQERIIEITPDGTVIETPETVDTPCEHPFGDAVRFFRHLYRNCSEFDGIINFRFKKNDGYAKNEYINVKKLDDIPRLLQRYSDWNCWFNPSLHGIEDGTKDTVFVMLVLWIDHDNFTPEAEKKLNEFPFKPAFNVRTSIPSKRQIYWLLKEPILRDEINKFENILRRLVVYFGSDKAAVDASRVLRVPGTINIKPEYNSPTVIVLEPDDSDREYSLEELDEFLPQLESPTGQPVLGKNPEGWEQDLLQDKTPGERHGALAQLAGRYIQKGLSKAEILPLLLSINAKYNPPLSEKVVEGILDDIIKTHGRRHPGRKIEDIPQDTKDKIFLMAPEGIWDDAGMGETFSELFGYEFCFIKEMKEWYEFNGINWVSSHNEAELAMVQAVDINHAIHLEKEKGKEKPNYKAIAGFHHAYRSENKVRACLNMAENHLYKKIQLFDRNPWVLVCANGVIDLKTGQFRDGTPDDMFLKNTGVTFSPEAQCPMWEKSIDDIFTGNKNLIAYIQRAVGYSLTGDVREDAFFLLWGGGSNGKTTLLEILLFLVGGYATEIPFEVLESAYNKGTGQEATPYIAKLCGVRFVKSSETRERSRFNVGRLKHFSGDTLTGRFLHENPFEFEPTHKLWLSVNHKPRVDDDTNAMWRRIHLIPFNVEFKKPEEAFGEDKVMDRGLRRRLRTELPGILNWGIKGCLEWQRQGLNPPPEVLSATEEYRKESDVMSRFLEDEAVREPEHFETSLSLFKTCVKWCGKNGEKYPTQIDLGLKLKAKGFESTKQGGTRGFVGIRLIEPVRDDDTCEDKIEGYRRDRKERLK